MIIVRAHFKAFQLNRDLALVVVHGDAHIEFLRFYLRP
jgi:hypothetical protein